MLSLLAVMNYLEVLSEAVQTFPHNDTHLLLARYHMFGAILYRPAIQRALKAQAAEAE